MKQGEAVVDLATTQAPCCVQGPWAVPRAAAPRRPLLSSCDEMPASQQPLEHSSQTNLRYPAAAAAATAAAAWEPEGFKELPQATMLATI